MSLIARAAAGTEFEIAPAGNSVARCYALVDLGMQERHWNGKVNYKRIVRISWELPDELMDDGRPFSITQNYTLSLSEMANLRKDLESWRGQAFTDEELAGFDLKNVLGAPAMINVIHRHADNGKTYANVGSVSPLPKGLVCPDRVNDILYFSLDEPDWRDKYETLPEWLQGKINVDLTTGLEEMPPPGSAGQEDFPDDDIPF